MPSSLSTVCDWLGWVVPVLLLISAFGHDHLLSDVDPKLSINAVLAVEEFWTAEKLSSMAGSSTMAAAVSCLTDAAHESGAAALKLDGIKALIDGRTAADLRTAIFKVTDGGMTDKFANFARNTNAVATCSTPGTAGWNGLDACLAGCEQKRYFLAWTPNKGACHVLCALATSPCTKDVAAGTITMRPVSWGTMATDWRETLASVLWLTVHMVLFPLYVANMVVNCLAVKAHLREAEKQLSEMQLAEMRCDWWISFRDALLDLDALEIDLDSVDGGQRRAQGGQLSASRRARLRREEGGVRLARRRD